MILVIIGHTNYQQPLLTLIYSFHMPLFFIVSGILYNENKYDNFGSFIIKKTKSLLLPFLVYVSLTLVLAIIENIQNIIEMEQHTYILSILKSMMIARNSSDFLYNAPLWFVPTLFLIECVYYFVNKLKDNDIFVITTVALFLIGWYSTLLSKKANIFIWNIPTCCFSIGFYAIGHRGFRYFYFNKDKLGLKNQNLIIISIFSFALMVPVALANEKISLGSNIVNCAPLLYVSGVLGTISVLSLSQIISSRFVEFIGRNSFIFLGIHGLVRYVIIHLLMKVFSIDFWKVCDNYLYTLPMFVSVFSFTFFIVIITDFVKKWKKKGR